MADLPIKFVEVIKYPQIKINSKDSKWNAVHHPITFEFQRKDLLVIKTTNLESKFFRRETTMLRINSLTKIPPEVKVGQYITIIINGVKHSTIIVYIGTSSIEVEGKITGNVGFILLDGSYNSYYLEVEIYGVDTKGVYKPIGITRCTSNDMGVIKVNVQEWLQTQSVYNNNFGYDRKNQLQIGESGKFNIVWRAVYNGLDEGVDFTTLNEENAFYWTNSSKQIKDVYSANMGDYNPTLDETRTNKAKFLSVFDKPTYFVGYPFSISFIYSEQLENNEISRREVTKNINGGVVASTSDLLYMDGRGYINRLMLKQSYPSSVKTINLYLEYGFTETILDDIQWDEPYVVGGVFTPWGEKEIFTTDDNYVAGKINPAWGIRNFNEYRDY